MSRSALKALYGRSALLLSGVTVLVAVPSLPAFAATPPTVPSGLTVTIGDRYADLSWNDGNGDGAIVRDVTGVASAVTPTSGRAVPVSTPFAAHDTGFRNIGTTRYAIWSTASDGTPSSSPLLQDVLPAPIAPTVLSLQLSHRRLAYGVPLTIAGRLTRTVGGTVRPAVGEPVRLYGVTGGSSAKVLLRRLVTDGTGRVRTTLKPSKTVALSLAFSSDAFSASSTSPPATLRLLPRVTLTARPASIVRGKTTVLAGRVAPGYAGARVLLQGYWAHGWHGVANARTDGKGGYHFTVRPALGVHSYRALLAGTSGWLLAGSPVVRVSVSLRNLASGMTGSDVLALKRDLAALHYAPGRLNGTFGADLKHAVYAFQKVERLPRTGRWSRIERARLSHPTRWRVRFPSAGTAVEVDVTRQVLVLSRGGTVVRIVDVSTGGGYHYTSGGVSYLAKTPRGHFRVQRKIDGVRTSKLGYLYRPAYFSGGYAVHGEGYDVPATPASHGCVRVTNDNQDYLFPRMATGTPVTIFDE